MLSLQDHKVDFLPHPINNKDCFKKNIVLKYDVYHDFEFYFSGEQWEMVKNAFLQETGFIIK